MSSSWYKKTIERDIQNFGQYSFPGWKNLLYRHPPVDKLFFQFQYVRHLINKFSSLGIFFCVVPR